MRPLLAAIVSCLLLKASAMCGQRTSEALEADTEGQTVSMCALLSPVGHLQSETGTLYAATSPSFASRFELGETFRVALNSRLEAIATTETFIHSTGSSAPGYHPGETFLGVQTVVIPGQPHRPTISTSYIWRAHDSVAPELDIGSARQSASLLVSGDVFGFHLDGNFIAAEQTNVGLHQLQLGQTFAASREFRHFTVSGELWHFTQPSLHGNAVGNLWSVGVPLRSNVVLSTGFDHGITGSSTHWEEFAGLTFVLPHCLWKHQR